jgi:hypothetical protein
VNGADAVEVDETEAHERDDEERETPISLVRIDSAPSLVMETPLDAA